MDNIPIRLYFANVSYLEIPEEVTLLLLPEAGLFSNNIYQSSLCACRFLVLYPEIIAIFHSFLPVNESTQFGQMNHGTSSTSKKDVSWQRSNALHLVSISVALFLRVVPGSPVLISYHS